MYKIRYSQMGGGDDNDKVEQDNDATDISTTNNNVNPPLITAINDKNMGKITELLNNPDIDVNSPDKDGYGPLFAAIEKDNIEIFNKLIDSQKIDINKSFETFTPLMIIATLNKVAIVKLLLARSDIDVNAKTNDGITALIAAVKNNNDDIVKLLLTRSDIDVNANFSIESEYTDRSDKYTALSYAKKFNKQKIIKLFENKLKNSCSTATSINSYMQKKCPTESTANKILALLQDEHADDEPLEDIQAGGYYIKYLKYKQKYLDLKRGSRGHRS
jgi:ankyrin repeat protein